MAGQAPDVTSAEEKVIVGYISGIHGVQGWVKIFSHTAPKQNILNYNPWYLKTGGNWQPRKLLNGRLQGKLVVAQLEGCTDRDQARLLMNTEIAINRDQLAKLEDGEYYWADLIGLQVENLDQVVLGTIDHLFETGANDVIVVQGDRQRLIPFVMDDVIQDIDLVKRRMVVDWHPDD
jgi:16S rRNA processing protein RimM